MTDYNFENNQPGYQIKYTENGEQKTFNGSMDNIDLFVSLKNLSRGDGKQEGTYAAPKRVY
jgi:hypothetical protein